MPLVHFPASARFDEGSDGPHPMRRKALEQTFESSGFGEHVFVQAGPFCSYDGGSIGDATIYFPAGIEADHKGSTTPFASGSLEDTPPRLQPFRAQNASTEDRFAFFKEHETSLSDWRARFERWLAYSYNEPDRYLETTADRYTAGVPDRLEPALLLEHNGPNGVRRYGPGECGDRRAWTWEVRLEDTVSLEQACVLHVPFDSIERALEMADKIRWTAGHAPCVATLPREVPGSFQALYEQSGSVLRKLVDETE